MTTAETSGSLTRNPYVGPVPFRDGQKLYGREKETDELVDLLVSKRIVLLIAPSGAGKTSLIQAALIPRLRDRYKLQALPTVRLTYRSEAIGERSDVNRYALSTMRSLEGHFAPDQRYSDEQLADMTLGRYFDQRFPISHDGTSRQHWLLVLDQFEELFTLDPLDVGTKRAYLEDLGNVLAGVKAGGDESANAGPPTLWALFSMREDHVAELQPFLDLIPTGLAFRYRIDLLERDRALEPVAKPAGSAMDPETAPRLVEGLLTIQLRTPEGKEVTREGRFVEPVQLQVVCLRLWDRVVDGEKRTIGPDDVDQADIEQALSDYIDTSLKKAASAAKMSEKVLRDWIEGNVITSTGIRAQALREPVVLGKLNDAIELLIDESRLIRSDKRNDREWIELAHDRLVGPLRASNKAWRSRHLKPFQRQAELYANTGQTHEEMLFWGNELIEAERFAAEHPDELNDDERKFLKDSRHKRNRLTKERRNRQKLLAAGVLAFFVIGGLIVQNALVAKKNSALIEAQNRKLAEDVLRSKLRREISSAREVGKPVVDSIRELLQVHDEISVPPTNNLWRFFDSTLRETLQKIPRALESRVGSRDDLVRSLAFMSGGNRLIAGSWDGTISIWRVDGPGPALFTGESQGAETYATAWHEATNTLASTYLDGKVILWRVTETGLERLKVLDPDSTGYRKQVTTAGFNRAGTLLATAGWDKKIVLWNVTNPSEPARVSAFGSKFHVAPIQRIVFLPLDQQGQRLGLDRSRWQGRHLATLRDVPAGSGRTQAGTNVRRRRHPATQRRFVQRGSQPGWAIPGRRRLGRICLPLGPAVDRAARQPRRATDERPPRARQRAHADLRHRLFPRRARVRERRRRRTAGAMDLARRPQGFAGPRKPNWRRTHSGAGRTTLQRCLSPFAQRRRCDRRQTQYRTGEHGTTRHPAREPTRVQRRIDGSLARGFDGSNRFHRRRGERRQLHPVLAPPTRRHGLGARMED